MPKPDLYTYAAIITHVVDGDTVDARVDLGFDTFRDMRFRLSSVNTPERGKEGYQEAKDFMIDTVLGKNVYLATEQDRTGGFGRYLATVWHNGQSVNTALLKRGLAVPYVKK